MNPSLAKELRALRLAWSLCALAGLGNLLGIFSDDAIAKALPSIAAFAFFAGCLALAAAPFGHEFPLRTWPLLLGQPMERSRLWKTKFLAGTIAVLALVAVHAATVIVTGQRIPSDDLLIYLGFVVATICSAGWCALASRSVIGGMAFAAGCQFAIMALVSGVIYAGYKILGRDPVAPDMDKSPVVVTYIIAGVAYSVFTLWLGWRTFKEMEMRDAPASANLALPSWMTPKKLSTLFRCRPNGSLRNLILKEVGLQAPVFTIAAVFTACWIAVCLLLLMEPTRHAVYVGILNGLTGVHIVIIALLSGCVSLGDEKTLGVTAWHLTLPVSARRQWFVKLAVSAATAVVVGVILPLFLSCLTLVKDKVGLINVTSRDIAALIAAIWVLVVLGFWCASFWENTVRAALSTIVALVGIGTFAQLGAWVASEYFSGLQTSLVVSVISHLQLAPDFFEHHEAMIPYSIALVCLVVAVIALAQSLAQFRRVRSSRFAMLKNALILAAITFVGAFWCADLVKSISRPGEPPLVAEVADALGSVLRQDPELSEGQVRRVLPQELESDDLLSNTAKRWLRNSTIDVHWITLSDSSFARRYGNGPRSYIGELHLPNGVTVPLDWTAPDPTQTHPPKEKP